MDMRPPRYGSSHIAATGYDEENGTLAIQFHKGGVYHYSNVDPEIYESLHGSASPGDFFHTSIRGKFQGKKQ